MSAPQVAFLPADHRKPRSLSATALSRPSKSNFALGSAIKTTTSNTSPSLTTANLIDKRTVEQQLIDNLRQQVAVLELENAQLKKERSVAWANTAPTHQHHHDEHGRPVSASAAGVRANLLQRIEALQAEVDGLRKAYARREQEHAVEMAEARNRMAENFRGSGFRSTGGQSGAGGLVSSDEVQQIRQQFEKDLNNAKDRYAQEVVHFEKTIDRLKAEAASHAAEHAAIQKEKEELTKELIIVKDAGRTSITNYEVLQRQYQEALHQLAQEQDRRRDVENKESDAKHRIADLQAQIAAYSAGKSTSELESKLKDVTARLNVVSFEFDKIRVTEAKMSADMQDMLKEKAERDVNDAIRSNEIEGLKTRLAQLEAKLTDVEAEREFFRLSTDRLKVENSVLAVKISQLEAKHNSDRASVLTLERQYAASLDTIEVLRRESKLKENVYKSLDEHDSTLRQQVYLAQEETNALRRANQDIREAFVDVSTKYDAIKDHADAIKAEQHLQAALQRLDRTKSEMHNLLQTQLKLSNDISAVIDDIPSDVSVHQHLHRSTLISGTSPVPPPHRTGGGGTTDMVEVSGVSAVPPPATIEVLSTITTTQ